MSRAAPQRFASVIKLRPEHREEYVRLHGAVPPAVLSRLHEAHVGNYSIFLRDGLLFSYLEYSGEDYTADMATIAEDPATRRWWELTDPCQQPLDTIDPGQWWAPVTEVFHLD
ncbi:MAG: L-rhamnose mutarotase [Frankiales bacterium]|nr:L-rhamnose mutarotase [Frankiales bacterium]